MKDLELITAKLAGPDMLIDCNEQYNQQENEVVNISPDDASEEPAEAPIRADDCKLPGRKKKWSSMLMASQLRR